MSRSSCHSARTRRTRQDIHLAALELARTRPVQEITVEQIAAAAEVSRRTFFNHFPTKNDAFIPDLDVIPPQALEDFAMVSPHGLLDAMETLVLARMELLEPILDDDGLSIELVHANPELHPLFMARVREFELAVGEAAASRLAAAPTAPEVLVTAGLVSSLERAVLETWRVSPEGTVLSDLVHAAVEGLRDALNP
ncbi:TetR/AcrR family transcriptional regulator [Actinomyces sp.]|uniref:TetR/AcrR family transcriptional regulator n=1 Tax=Actinomyces sp. TaxID=29317 RepID=UPI002898AF45|nr:TetR/AcrR family transcriptional regulator [Actinomyces sp.]